MSHYKPYPAYKESGVEWMGEVPAHWQLRRLKHMARFTGGGTPSRDNPQYWNGHIPWVSPKDMKAEVISGAEESITDEGLKGGSSSIVPAGRVLMVVRSGILKHTIPVAINDVDVALNQDMKAIWLDSNYLTEPYFLRFVQGLNDELLKAWLKQGATVESIEQDYLSNSWMPVPPHEERERILEFISRESTRIDALVEKKARFIELLREKRQALITQAVTKGVDPNVKMKDSGVEWLGEVPAHWTVLSFQRCVYIAEGQVNPEEQPYSSMMLVAPNHIESGTGRLLYTETAAEQMAESGKYLCRGGDVIYSKIRPALRKACIAPVDCLCSADMYPLRGDDSLLNHYLLWFLLSEPFSAFAVLEADRVAMPKINRESLNALKLALPPVEEQANISRKLTQATTRIDAVIEKTERSIELLKERRSALITAAVTGQIDLRESAAAAGHIERRATA
ncbi:restriction endonuclease subunit S [Burkholderia vietnamiensis]|uniref:restriction endonuclease subunit S n=1 Tax=Burkholderia vietnamiensis TaxID=60552 RepID=UPI001B909842|nr:restriction endonuclease subunit S [Burkholderia vietnamiensis]MBR8219577.1 restriction endonuclease subunit S [Burkholderia vietnamiensis]